MKKKNKMNAENLIKNIKKANLEPLMFHYDEFEGSFDFNWDDYKSLSWEETHEIYQNKFTEYLSQYDIGSWEEVDSQGGGEGGGEHFHSVIFFKDHNVYLRADGTYYSYDGINGADEFYEVEPQEKTITIYIKK